MLKVELAQERGGISFLLDDADGRDSVVEHVRGEGLAAYEVPFPSLLADLVATTPVFFDIGANTGLFSLLAAAANSELKVYAFEPLPAISSFLTANLRLNPVLETQIQVERVALSDRIGRATMREHINPFGLIATSSTLEQEGGDHSDEMTPIEIEITTLDHWMIKHESCSPGIIKIDVEGHEVAMFGGALNTLRRHRPIMIVELLGFADFDFFQGFVASNEYVDIALAPTGARREPRVRFHGDAWNHVFCPIEKLAQVEASCRRIGLPIV